jgi:hypothetical protein
MIPSSQHFYNEQINTTVLGFVYCVEVLLQVSTLSGHHQAIITLFGPEKLVISIFNHGLIITETYDYYTSLFRPLGYVAVRMK